MSVNSKMTAIADEIRAKTGKSDTLNLDQMAESIKDVYEAGKNEEYDMFWDNFQFNGTRTAYNRAFCMWRASIFKPKYDLIPARADYMFMDMFPEHNSDGGYSLVKALSDAKVTLDTSQCTNFSYMFYYSYVNEIGTIDTRKATSINAIFNYARTLKDVEKLILRDDGTQTLNNSFESASALKNITIEGVIGKSVNLRWSPLSKESITNITEHLSDSASGETITLNSNAVKSAFETSPGAGDGSTSETFKNLVSSKTNWTFALN